MDELTIADQKYLSSKKAAQVTGYAKDYVGQLCREGRVTARLVGRNWYVLESSILEHRFGAAEETPDPHPEEKPAIDTTWKSPIYKAEMVSPLPEFTPSTPDVPVAAPQKVLTDMQSAWQEWFASQQEKEKMLPDASEMLLPEGEETNSDQFHAPAESGGDTSVHVVKEPPVFEEEAEETVHISRVEPLKESVVPITAQRRPDIREVASTAAQEVPVIRTVRQVPRPTIARSVPRASARRARRGAGRFVMQAILLSLAGLALAITVLGSDLAEQFGVGIDNPVSNFFAGVSTIKSGK